MQGISTVRLISFEVCILGIRLEDMQAMALNFS